MLSYIELTNFKIFKQKTRINFKATKYESLKDSNTKYGCIKTALFYGQNGSGKTSILKAISSLIEMIFRDVKFAPTNICSFSKRKESTIKYGFLIDGNEIEYSFTININSDIKEEQLFVNKEEVFLRIGTSAKTVFISNCEPQDIDSKVLFLKALKFRYGFKELAVLDKWFNFLKNSIIVDEKTNIFKYSPEITNDSDIFNFLNNEGDKKINEFFEAQGIPYELISEKVNVFGQTQLFVSLKNKVVDNKIGIHLESYGNRILLNYLIHILAVEKSGGMILFDEFGGGLHNKLNELLLRYMNKNLNNVQTFICTHETNLMKTVLTRPDQIYLVDFSQDGSFIKRASDFNPREAQNIEKMYLAGVFGGMPTYNKN